MDALADDIKVNYNDSISPISNEQVRVKMAKQHPSGYVFAGGERGGTAQMLQIWVTTESSNTCSDIHSIINFISPVKYQKQPLRLATSYFPSMPLLSFFNSSRRHEEVVDICFQRPQVEEDAFSNSKKHGEVSILVANLENPIYTTVFTYDMSEVIQQSKLCAIGQPKINLELKGEFQFKRICEMIGDKESQFVHQSRKMMPDDHFWRPSRSPEVIGKIAPIAINYRGPTPNLCVHLKNGVVVTVCQRAAQLQLLEILLSPVQKTLNMSTMIANDASGGLRSEDLLPFSAYDNGLQFTCNRDCLE